MLPQFLSPYLSRMVVLALNPALAQAGDVARQGTGHPTVSPTYQAHANLVRVQQQRDTERAKGPTGVDGTIAAVQTAKRAAAVRQLVMASVAARTVLPALFAAYTALLSTDFSEVRRAVTLSWR
jgi:hypothetical protein